MSKHTSGPWGLVLINGVYVVDEGGCTVADITYQLPDHDGETRRMANAHLIAAAPELLSALVDARKTLSSAIRANWEGATEQDVADHITIKVIDAAIARATGAQQ